MNDMTYKLMVWLRKFLVFLKVNIGRSLSYVSIINAGMILFLLLSRLQDYGVQIHITKWFFPIFIISLIGAIIFGYFDYKFGVHREEERVQGSRNPYLIDIIERLDRLESMMKKN